MVRSMKWLDGPECIDGELASNCQQTTGITISRVATTLSLKGRVTIKQSYFIRPRSQQQTATDRQLLWRLISDKGMCSYVVLK